MEDKKYENEKRKLKPFQITVLVLIIILVLILLSIFWFISGKWGKVNKVDLNKEDIAVSTGVEDNLANFRNVAILGIDSREDTYSKGNRSDCIIIASINNNTKDVKMFSVYRDTYVQIEGHGLDKITHAYSYGGAELALNTLNTNLDLNIEEFVVVNFDAVKDAVNNIGGVTINITDEEASHISGIDKAGTYNLTGEQALAYARIRHAEGGDYKRTERMRDVIAAIVEKVKTFNISQINKFIDEMLPKIYTNMTAADVFSFLPSITSVNITDSIGWPYNIKGITLDRWYGVPITLESNVERLHKEIFGEDNYIVSNTVKQISQDIIEKTGYSE